MSSVGRGLASSPRAICPADRLHASPCWKYIDAHVHNPVPRTVAYTQETYSSKREYIRVDFFDESQNVWRAANWSGECDPADQGWARFRDSEEIEMIEVKQGPYAGDADKTRFKGRRPGGSVS